MIIKKFKNQQTKSRSKKLDQKINILKKIKKILMKEINENKFNI